MTANDCADTDTTGTNVKDEPSTKQPTIDEPVSSINRDFEFAEVSFTGHEFRVVNTATNDVCGRVLHITTRPVYMTDETCEGLLECVGLILSDVHASGGHLSSLYDLREHRLPRTMSEAYARAKQLAAWCGTMVTPPDSPDQGASKIDLTLHSVAVVIPSGFSAKLVRKLVDLVLWLTNPPMDPRVFDGSSGGLSAAQDFVRQRRKQYLAGELPLKPKPKPQLPCPGERPPTLEDQPRGQEQEQEQQQLELELPQAPPSKALLDGRSPPVAQPPPLGSPPPSPPPLTASTTPELSSKSSTPPPPRLSSSAPAPSPPSSSSSSSLVHASQPLGREGFGGDFPPSPSSEEAQPSPPPLEQPSSGGGVKAQAQQSPQQQQQQVEGLAAETREREQSSASLRGEKNKEEKKKAPSSSSSFSSSFFSSSSSSSKAARGRSKWRMVSSSFFLSSSSSSSSSTANALGVSSQASPPQPATPAAPPSSSSPSSWATEPPPMTVIAPPDTTHTARSDDNDDDGLSDRFSCDGVLLLADHHSERPGVQQARTAASASRHHKPHKHNGPPEDVITTTTTVATSTVPPKSSSYSSRDSSSSSVAGAEVVHDYFGTDTAAHTPRPPPSREAKEVEGEVIEGEEAKAEDGGVGAVTVQGGGGGGGGGGESSAPTAHERETVRSRGTSQEEEKEEGEEGHDDDEEEEGLGPPHQSTPLASLPELRALLHKQRAQCPHILRELETHKRKVTCWAWWVFPTDKEGASEPAPKTRVDVATAPMLLEQAPPEWRLCLETVAALVAQQQQQQEPQQHSQRSPQFGRKDSLSSWWSSGGVGSSGVSQPQRDTNSGLLLLTGVLPAVDHGRVAAFVRFWRDVPNTPAWLADVLAVLGPAAGVPSPPLSTTSMKFKV